MTVFPFDAVPAVDAQETLARFVLFTNPIRRSDGTVKLDAFIPHPRQELSVTRHRDATVEELWAAGGSVAVQRQRTLYGRADLLASACLNEGLTVEAVPLPENPNHADIAGWPEGKAEQKMKAIEISPRATFLPSPSA